MNWSRNCFYSLCAFLCVTSAYAFQIDLFPPHAFPGVPLELIAKTLRLKTNNFVVESFESEHLIEEIASNITGGKDGDGGPNQNAWDGTRTSLEHDSARFVVQQSGIRVFGIGLGDNDFGRESVSINGNAPVQLSRVGNHRFTGGGKAYYLVITAEEGDADIQKVEFLDGFTIAFDHLILGKSDGALPLAKASDAPRERVRQLNAMVERISNQQRSRLSPSSPEPNLPAKNPTSSGIALLSPEGTPFLGNQLQFFSRAEPGVLSVEKPSWLYLYWTEGREFTLSGEVRLGGGFGDMTFAGDLPDGFALFLREWDGMHRYQLDSRRVLAKRRLLKGTRLEAMQQLGELAEPARNQWLPFHAHVSQSGIHFTFGQSTTWVEGPLDIDGANKIAIAPGTKLRNLRLSFETSEGPPEAAAQKTPISFSQKQSDPQPGGALTIINGGFDNVPGQGDEVGAFGETMFSTGSERLPGWSVSDGIVGLRNDFKSPSGGSVLELGPRDTPGTVTQVILTVPGQRYILSFYASGPRGNHEIKVRAGDLERTIQCADVYERVALPFRASSQSTEISIGAIGESGFGPMIDDVRVEVSGEQ